MNVNFNEYNTLKKDRPLLFYALIHEVELNRNISINQQDFWRLWELWLDSPNSMEEDLYLFMEALE